MCVCVSERERVEGGGLCGSERESRGCCEEERERSRVVEGWGCGE